MMFGIQYPNQKVRVWYIPSGFSVDGSLEKIQDSWLEDSLKREGIDYEDTFDPVERYTSIRTIMALASMMKWDLHQMDVDTTFLNGLFEEEVYIEQPQGFEVKNRATHVCKLKKSLYGLK